MASDVSEGVFVCVCGDSARRRKKRRADSSRRTRTLRDEAYKIVERHNAHALWSCCSLTSVGTFADFSNLIVDLSPYLFYFYCSNFI